MSLTQMVETQIRVVRVAAMLRQSAAVIDGPVRVKTAVTIMGYSPWLPGEREPLMPR